MTAFDGDAFAVTAFAETAFDIDVEAEAAVAATTVSVNPSHSEICDLSGFKAKVGQLVPTWDGLMVLPQFWEPKHPQLMIRSRPEKQTGALRPEPVGNETFITDRILPEDL